MSNELVNNPVWVWGLPLARISLAATTETVDRLVKRRQPSFFITANTHYAMLTRDRRVASCQLPGGLPGCRRRPLGLGVAAAGRGRAGAGGGL